MDVNADDLDIKNNRNGHRFEAELLGYVGFLDYLLADGKMVLTHTEVPDELEGQGIGSKLVEAALEDARSQHLLVVPQCPFVASYIERHPEYMELVDPQYRE